jgi:hypothetical protein
LEVKNEQGPIKGSGIKGGVGGAKEVEKNLEFARGQELRGEVRSPKNRIDLSATRRHTSRQEKEHIYIIRIQTLGEE